MSLVYAKCTVKSSDVTTIQNTIQAVQTTITLNFDSSSLNNEIHLKKAKVPKVHMTMEESKHKKIDLLGNRVQQKITVCSEQALLKELF